MAGRILAAVGLAVVTLVLMQNAGNVSITFLVWQFDMPIDVLIVVSWLVGTVNGALYISLRRSRRSSKEGMP